MCQTEFEIDNYHLVYIINRVYLAIVFINNHLISYVMREIDHLLFVNKQIIEQEKEYDWIEKKDILVFKKGQFIYFEGSSPQGIYFIERGKVKVTKSTCSGKNFITHIATNGDILNYSDIYLDSKYSCSGIAMEDTVVHFIYKKDFQEALLKHPKLLEQFLNKLISHIRQLETKASNIAYKPVRSRLADALLSLKEKFEGFKEEEHAIVITRSDLAGLIGTVRETINRLLSEFRHEGLIKIDGTKIYILDLTKLQKISQL